MVVVLPDMVKFWVILAALVPSLICSIFVLYHLLFDRALRRGLHNHVIIVLLVICLIDEVTFYPWMLYYFTHETDWQRSYMFCLFIGFIDWSLYIVHTMVFAWAMIERHILIFHESWISTRRKRFLVHYVPLIALLLYWFVFYFVVYFFPPCENRFRPWSLICIYPCLYDNYTLSMWDFIAHQIVPIAIITVFSSGLILRVFLQKRRMRRALNWQQHRKMIIQALSIAFLYVIILLPFTVVYIIRYIYGISSYFIGAFYLYINFFTYFVILLYPFVCALTLPELKTRMTRVLKLQWQTTRVMSIT
ncbi:unnamed protein product [Adineta ricciae]|uniref:G-protein coupled receptors family 1 profile domain-containing protein n=1 Tax=Adineta ricciae TaxID=249248 RepID=A0A815JHU7_ADIRI|nr:unnamed protein product [Adineta ricciae]CAF1379984.1 unnamed protein product [Adineta ricciae]